MTPGRTTLDRQLCSLVPCLVLVWTTAMALVTTMAQAGTRTSMVSQLRRIGRGSDRE